VQRAERQPFTRALGWKRLQEIVDALGMGVRERYTVAV
jgi:hypothetical protein